MDLSTLGFKPMLPTCLLKAGLSPQSVEATLFGRSLTSFGARYVDRTYFGLVGRFPKNRPQYTVIVILQTPRLGVCKQPLLDPPRGPKTPGRIFIILKSEYTWTPKNTSFKGLTTSSRTYLAPQIVVGRCWQAWSLGHIPYPIAIPTKRPSKAILSKGTPFCSWLVLMETQNHRKGKMVPLSYQGIQAVLGMCLLLALESL